MLREDQALSTILLETYAASGRMNQILLENIDKRAWRAHPADDVRKTARTIADIFAHIHNNRLVWLKRSAPHLNCPKQLDPARCTVRQAATAHRKSADSCLRMLKDALSERSNRRVLTFSRGSWAHSWPAGATMFAYMFAHEAHHRGQIIMLTHRVGYGMNEVVANSIWQWDGLWEELGFAQGPR